MEIGLVSKDYMAELIQALLFKPIVLTNQDCLIQIGIQFYVFRPVDLHTWVYIMKNKFSQIAC